MLYILLFYMFMISGFLFMLFLYFLLNKIVIFCEYNLLKFMSIKMELLMLLDWISLLFMSVVIFISVMVILYSIEYMEHDKEIMRFIIMVLMFVISMLLMIISPNLISILIGWDGLGLVSYCLVIYYQSKNSFNSGMVTVLINRVGDIFILMSIVLMMMIGSWNIMFLSDLEWLIVLFMMLASFTKSAQLPFSSWLPMAMAAPTPVSSLVHSSTLVTAGVYLMVRLNYLILSINLMKFMLLVSVMTMFMSGLGANFEFDLKKIIALSTLSQLGVMMFSLSIKLNEFALFHLLTHAMFKSMLFMCAGVIIHNLMGIQDIRYINMVFFNMPLLSVMFSCSILSLCGIPFMSGFFSKDLILEMYLMSLFNKFILFILFISMGLTVMYSVRLIYYIFIKVPNLIFFMSYKMFNSKMFISMYMLFFFSIIGGLNLSWILFSLKNVIYLNLKFKLMIYYFMLMGIILGYFLPKFYNKMMSLFYLSNMIKFFSMMWFMPMLYGVWVYKILQFSNKFYYMIELGEFYDKLTGKEIIMFLSKFYSFEFLFKNFFFMVILYLLYLFMIIY